MGFLLKKEDKENIAKSKETCWEAKLDTVSECSKSPSSIDVFISPMAKDKIERLMEKFKNIEWLAYLVGEEFDITDIYIPKQTVTAGSVSNIDSSVCNRIPIIGVIHSHHNMGNDFSGTDNDWINQNNDISLCISKSGINGHVRWKTPCGSLITVKAIVRLKVDIDYDIEMFEKIIKENIKRSKIHTPKYNSNGQWNYYKGRRSCYGIPGYDDEFDAENNSGVIDTEDDDGIEKFIESLDVEKDLTLEEELEYMKNSGMFEEEKEEEKEEENSFTT